MKSQIFNKSIKINFKLQNLVVVNQKIISNLKHNKSTKVRKIKFVTKRWSMYISKWIIL